jgi:hypothetical protein
MKTKKEMLLFLINIPQSTTRSILWLAFLLWLFTFFFSPCDDGLSMPLEAEGGE